MKNNLTNIGSVDSTQTYVKSKLKEIEYFDSFYATTQTNGYGRTGAWDSSFENLYFTKLLPIGKHNHLTAVCSMHMLISNYEGDVEIKVPNDLYCNHLKLGGVLIENIGEYAILGIGININGSPQGFTSLSKLTNIRYDIDDLAQQLDELINLNLTMAIPMLESYYKQNCHLVGDYIEYTDLQSGDQFSGTVTDLDSEFIYIDDLKFNQMQIKILNK